MQIPFTGTLRRNRAIVAALTAALLAAAPVHAQATAQPTKTATPQTKAAQPAAKPAQPPAKPAATPAKTAEPIKPNRVFVDINHATLKELKQIPGIGDVYGKKIIAGRPYANKSQLVSRKIIDDKLYETIQGMIVAKQ